jgi:hypothetical protein
VIIGWDIATHLTGWCAGTGETVPVADAFRLADVGLEYGAKAAEFRDLVHRVHRRFPATHWIFESPLLVPGDKLATLRQIYGLEWQLEEIAHELGIICREETPRRVKMELAGFSKADKIDMVRCAEKIGVSLPATIEAGRYDAADATGAWKLGVRLYAPRFAPEWDRRLYSSRGALL